MKLVMFGPGYGHNAKAFIDLLGVQNETDCYYICRGNTEWSSKNKLKILTYSSFFSLEIIQLLKKEASFVWVHGGYDLKQLLQILFYSHKQSFLSLNVWGEQVPKQVVGKGLKAVIYQKILRKMNQVHCNWYGTYEILKSHFDNVSVYPWGLSPGFFTEDTAGREGVSEFTSQFIHSLPVNRYLFFYPKSILEVSGHTEVLEACHKLVQNKVSNFVVYFWVGNSNDEKLKNDCEKLIEKYQLESQVKIVSHPFVSFEDMKLIWQKMNCGLQIAKSDQLSTTFLEPQYMQKEIIATNIFPYEKYNQKLGAKLNLVSINSGAIAKEMEMLILDTKSTSKETLLLRKKIVKENFDFDKNILNMIQQVRQKIS